MPFDDVSQQLVTLTRSEEDLLSAKNHKPPSHVQQQAMAIADAWTRTILAPVAQPPQAAPIVPFEGNQTTLCDIIRTRYSWAGRQVDIGQTFCLFSVTIAWPKPADEGVTDFIRKVARTLLADPLRFVPQVEGSEGTMTFGGQTPAQPAPEFADYIDQLRWWCDGQRVGFVTLKVEHSPGRAVMAWDKELNLVWFDLYKR